MIFPVRYIRTNSESCGRILTLAKSLNRIFILYHIDGEPSHPIQQEYTFHPAPYQRSSYEFEYRMLSKLQSDCEYYLGYGNRSPSILCNHSVQNHIARMKELWNGFPTDQKPEWLTWEQLLQYEKVMTETGIPVKNCSD